MPMTTLQVVAEALKEFYLPGLRYQLNDRASPFLAQVEKKTENVVGKEIVMAMRYGRVGGIGNRADDGELPTPNSRKTKQARWETKNLFSRFQITDKTIKASRTSAGAFASLLEQEISDCEADAKLDLSRQALGDGVGTLATVTNVGTGDVNSQVFTVDTTMYLAEGMIVDLIDVSANDAPLANATGMEVLLVDDATSQVTVKHGAGASIASSAGANDYLVVSGNLGLELTGVAAVMSADTLYGLSRATYPWLKAYTKDVNNNEISENIIQAAIDRVETKTSSQINFIQCAYDVRRAYIDLLSANKQTVNSLELKGGWKAISYNGIPIVADKYLPNGTMDLLDLNDWAMYQMSDFEWMDADGAVLTRVANKAAYEATLYKYCDLGCQRPAGQARLSGIKGH